MLMDGKISIRFKSKTLLVNFTYENNDWWLDSEANIYVCFNRNLSKCYQNSSGGSMTLENNSITQLLGVGQVDLRMTSGKILTLESVWHVLEIRRNLVSGSSLVQQGYKLVMESNKVVIIKNNIFVGRVILVMVCLSWM